MASKDTFLESVTPDTKENEQFCLKVYGFNISYPGYAELVMQKLEGFGFFDARKQYQRHVKNYERKHNAKVKEATTDIAKLFREERKRSKQAYEQRVLRRKF